MFNVAAVVVCLRRFLIVFYLLPDSWFFVRVFFADKFLFLNFVKACFFQNRLLQKKQTESKRTLLLNLIQANALCFSIGIILSFAN